MAVAHLIFLGIIGELVVGMSNGTRIEMPEVMKEKIDVRSERTNADKKEYSR
jgi:hypothetical protein